MNPSSQRRASYNLLTPHESAFDVQNIPHTLSSLPSRLRPYVESSTNDLLSTISSLTVVKQIRTFIKINAGLLLIAASQGFFSLMNVAVKTLNSLDPPVPALELVFVRMFITYLCCMTYMLLRKVPDPFLGPPGVRTLLAFRGFTGFFGLFGVYYSLQYLSLSDATVLTFIAPLTTALAGCLFLGEQFSRKEALAGLFCLLGVILIARPRALFGAVAQDDPNLSDGHGVDGVSGSHEPPQVSPSQRLVAVGVALIGVCGATGAYTSMRAIGKRAHTLHSMAFFSLWCCIVSSILIPVLHVRVVLPTRIDWLGMLLMIGFFGFSAQALLTMGLQRETASRGSMVVYTQIIYATIFERIFFHTTPSILSVLGTLIIMGGAVYIVLLKNQNEVSTEEPRINPSGRPSDVERELLLENGDLPRDSHELAELITPKRPSMSPERSRRGHHLRMSSGSYDAEDPGIAKISGGPS